MHPQSMFRANIRKNIKDFLMKIFIFETEKTCLLHRHVCVMLLQFRSCTNVALSVIELLKYISVFMFYMCHTSLIVFILLSFNLGVQYLGMQMTHTK